MISAPTEKGKTMADHKNCKYYSDCDYRNAVGECPDRCVQYKHKDDVRVVRCKECKHYHQYHQGKTNELCEWGKCKLISMDVDMPENGYCCYGERKDND